MDILTLTNTDAIRATLGIDDHDYSDAELASLELVSEFSVHMPTWFPLWSTLMADVSGDDDILRQQLALKIYARYYGARVVLTAGPMAFLMRRSDGEVESYRFNTHAISNLEIELDMNLAKRRAQVLEIATAYTPTVSATAGQYPQFRRAQNSRDIITE